MDRPHIRYARTPDGVNLAYFEAGEGYPLVHMPYPMNHLELQWQSPVFGAWYEALAGRYRLIAYDGRGQGLSDRDVADLSVDAAVADLRTIIDAAGVERFALYNGFFSGFALAAAASMPARISHLILWSAILGGGRPGAPDQGQAHGILAQLSWDLYLDTLAFWLGYGDEDDPATASMREFLHEGVDPASYLRMMMAGDAERERVIALLPEVRAPTLVVLPRRGRLSDVAEARQLVAALPDARLTLVEGLRGVPAQETLAPTLEAVHRFIGAAAPATPAAARLSGLQIIVFTDVEASTQLTDRFGDARARQILREQERLTRDALAAHAGREVKTMGDGFMAAFGSASAALDAAIALQRASQAAAEASGTPVRIRIGINAGEPIAEENDLFGTAVIQAARLLSEAAGGEIVVTDVVRQLVKGKDYLFSDLGVRPLRGFDEPVRLFGLRWAGPA